jgi:hypothetical protein
VIPNIVRGARVGGLLRYLYGPGKREEHTNPHLVAAWDGAGPVSTLEPPVGLGGKRDFRKLIDLLEQPVRRGFRRPDQPVWHCSIRTHPTDRWLSDTQWAHVAGEVMARVGLAPHGDTRAVRWVAMRHGPDHIHIVATLVRQDRRPVRGHNDRWLAQAACRDLEERYGLYRVGPADHTGHRRPTPAEVNKALRTGKRETVRDRLRREVRFAAATAGHEGEFFTLLHRAGLRVRARTSTVRPDEITGYAVALPDDTTGTGEPVWYSGGKLAPDLTLPKLRTRWGQPATATTPRLSGEQQAGIFEQAAAQVRAVADEIGRLGGRNPAAASAAAYAASDTLTAAARLVEGKRRGPLHRAAEAVDRATREPYRRRLPRTRRGEGLRSMSRLLRLAGELSGDTASEKTMAAMRRLIVELSLLAAAVADLRDAQQRLHQARAARTAARLLHAAGTRGGTAHPQAADATVAPASTGPSTVPTTGSPTRRRDARRQARPGSTGRTR